MTEISFTRSFLSALDSRPVKLSSDHTSDPRKFPAGAVYTLPRYPSSPTKRKRASSTSSDTTKPSASSTKAGPALANVQLANLKSPAYSLSLPSHALSASIYDLKTAYAARYHVPVDKIKLLHAKKPVADSKTLADVLGAAAAAASGGETVEFAVMLMGGVTPSDEPASAPSVAQGPSGKDILATEEFWTDLKGFLVQRLKDEKEGERLADIFREAAS